LGDVIWQGTRQQPISVRAKCSHQGGDARLRTIFGKMKALLISLFTTICISNGNLYSQNTIVSLNNTISLDEIFIFDLLEDQSSIKPDNIVFMLNYSRVLLKKELIKFKAQLGIGNFFESSGETDGFFPTLNTNVYINGLIGKNKHYGIIGLGLNFVPYYSATYLLLPIGYQFNFTKNFSLDLSLSPLLWYKVYSSDEFGSSVSKGWIWDTNSNYLWLNVGFNYNF
jgi:hypothetical protein